MKAFCLFVYLPKRVTNSPTEKEPKMPPTEKMATEMDQMVVREVGVMGSSYRSFHVSLMKFSMTCKKHTHTHTHTDETSSKGCFTPFDLS